VTTPDDEDVANDGAGMHPSRTWITLEKRNCALFHQMEIEIIQCIAVEGSSTKDVNIPIGC
jgi:hypothetical protein